MKINFRNAYPSDAYYEKCFLSFEATYYEDCEIIREWHSQLVEHLKKIKFKATK